MDQEQKDHPPIHPKSILDRGTYAEWVYYVNGGDKSFDTTVSWERKIVSHIMFAEWTQELYRLGISAWGSDDFHIAGNNAAEWEKWGKQKC